MSRTSCLDCGRKHIAQAEALMCEALLGYPLHAYLAIGHLAEAESELLLDHPEEAINIRAERVKYTDGLVFEADAQGAIKLITLYSIDSIELIRRLTTIAINGSGAAS